ncbi:MAG: hypothetical protein ACOYUB_00675 [Patescibacteria group bacterium]
MSKRIWQAISLMLVFILAACNMPSNAPSVTTMTIESKVTKVWEECVNNTGVFTHLCFHTKLTSFAEATSFDAGYTVPANALILVNDPIKGTNPFVINGNQPAIEGQDFYQVAGAQTGLASTYLTTKSLTMAIGGKQIELNQISANPSVLFPGWPNWPPVLPTQIVIQTPAAVDPTSTPNIIPAPFTSADLLSIWASLTPENNLVMLLDEAYQKWGEYYGGNFTTVTYSFIPAGTIIWETKIDNLADLNKLPIDPYGGCIGTMNVSETVVYTTCDLYVIQPPFKFLTISDWENFGHGMLPAPPYGIYP